MDRSSPLSSDAPAVAAHRAAPGRRGGHPAALALFALSALLSLAILFAGCGAPVELDGASSDALSSRLSPQSLTHGSARVKPTSDFLFTGSAGDDVQPDVWATPGAPNPLAPTLQLFGPPDASGKRPLLATGAPAADPGHLSLELQLPQSGTYLLSVGAQPWREGRFSLRFWTSASHAPRAEAMQVSLTLRPSDALESALSAHAQGSPRAGVAWSADEVDAIAATLRKEQDPLTAISDIAVLYSTLAAAKLAGLATESLVDKAIQLGAARAGTPQAFAALPASAQVLALYWLGAVQPAVFKPQAVDLTAPAQSKPLEAIAARIAALIASWRGAVEESSARKLTGFIRGGQLYGVQADWQADLLDSDGKTQAFTWQSRDFFSADGVWLGESSEGALLPDDG